MANKRIELEQYKHYVNLLKEEPNRKTVRKGVSICLIVMMVFCLGLFVLSILSNSLAQNPRNVLEKPPAPSTNPQVPSGTQIPEGVQIPQGTQIPEGTQIPQGVQVPSGTEVPTPSPTPTPVPPGGGTALDPVGLASDAGAEMLPSGTADGDLIAQATTIPTSPDQLTTPSTTPSSAPSTAPAKPPLSNESKGVGNLSNLAKGAGSRGWQIYSLVLAVGLIVLLYMGLRASKAEGRSK